MSNYDGSARVVVPTVPEEIHTAIAFQKVQRRYAERPVGHFPWKDFHLKLTGQGYVVGSDWAMTTFDTRTDDQFYDSKRLQTIYEGTEVRYFYPFDPLDYSNEFADLNVVDELRRLDLHERESLTGKLLNGVKDALTLVGFRIRNACCHLFACA